jgi:aspartate/methionine/tyrosine aminotransferase
VDFDPINGHRFLRLSFAGSTATMHEAVKRINEFVEAYKKDAA